MENISIITPAGSTFIRRYGIALLAAAGVMAIRIALMPLLGTRPPYITFYLGTVIAAAYGGMGPGLLVTFIGVAFGFVVLPSGPVVIAQEATRLGLFVLSGFGICLVAEGMHRQRRRVQEQAQELRRAAERLAELDRAKTAFFSNISHEFRTPLTLILGPTEDALNSPGRVLAGADLDTVHRNALRLLKLVNTLLDFARIEAGRIDANYQPTDLSRLTTDLASVFRSAVEKAGLSLVVDCPPLPEEVYVDRDMWEKIVLNLISNAFKFTFEGEIAVSLRQADGEVELAVYDTGTGIPDAEMPHIFDRFHHVKSAHARTHEGTGIGLALVQELVKLHAGSIKVESRLGEGTTFRVRVPLGSKHLSVDRIEVPRARTTTFVAATPFVVEARRWVAEPASSDAVRESSEMDSGDLLSLPQEEKEPARVLVAEDNADMRDYLRKLLERHWIVETVSDGTAALEAATSNPPGLVLADIMMPGLDGFELLRRLRAEPVTQEIPIVLLSARAGEEARVEGMAAGADDYLIKPFSARELVTRIGAHLKLSRVRREAREALHASEERLRRAISIETVGVLFFSLEGRLQDANYAFERMSGYTRQELTHMDDWMKLTAPEFVGVSERIVADLAEQGATDPYERQMIRKDGTRWWALCAPTRLTGSGRESECVEFIVDISQQKQAEAALRDSEQRLSEANRELETFNYSVAHDLRTPLTVISGYLELSKQRCQSGECQQYLQSAHEGILKMEQIIEGLLEFARVSRKEPIPQEVDLGAMAQEILHELQVADPERLVDLKITQNGITEGDSSLLRVVLTNLLGNAWKYTRMREQAQIEFGVQIEEGRKIFFVRDNGGGFEMKEAEKLFVPFQRLQSSAETQGHGIGLATVARIIERHGGMIWAEGEPGKGATFYFTLPSGRR